MRRRNPDIPILLATGYAEIDDSGASDLPRLAKPYTQNQLSAEISRLLPSLGADRGRNSQTGSKEPQRS